MSLMNDPTPSYRDQQGDPVVDPTKNVLDLVSAAIQRQDDLRTSFDHNLRQVTELTARHLREISDLRAEAEEKLRVAESARIDAIRKVDVDAVSRAAEVSAAAANALAAQVLASAEALRTQVASAASAATVALSAEIEPLKKDIADLRRAQYEAQGVKSNVGESRQNIGMWLAIGALVITIAGLAIALLGGR